METIKISVEVSVNLSESTQNFIKSLFTAGIPSGTQVAAPVAAQPTKSVQPVKPTAPAAPAQSVKPTAQPAQPAPTKLAVSVAPSAPAAPVASSASKTIEDVRALLAKKVNMHREAIKNKLNEYGSPSVTKLDPTKYDEMYNFLENLA